MNKKGCFRTFLCMAFLAACTTSEITPTVTMVVEEPTPTLETASLQTETPTPTATENPVEVSTPIVVTAQPTKIRPTATPVPNLPPLPERIGSNICPDTQPSLLMPGRKGRVSNESAAANRVRSMPGGEGEQIGVIPAGDYFDVLAGPQCVDGLAWFEVRTDSGLQGWMAEGNADEYWVMPIVTDALQVNGPEIALPGFTLTLPADFGSQMRVSSLPFDPEANTPPVTIARFMEYPLRDQSSAIYIYPVEDYLYYQPDRRAELEQVRGAINARLKDPDASITLASMVDWLKLNETYLVEAGTFQGGMGLRAIAMFSPSDGSQDPKPYYALWGFSSDMQYLVFAAMETNLTFGQPDQASKNDYLPNVPLLDQVLGLKIITKAPVAASSSEVKTCPGAPEIKLQIGDWARVSVEPPVPSRVRIQPGGSELLGTIPPGENVLIVDGPQCASGYTWWLVRNLGGLEGWAAEGDSEGYWLGEPISAWYALPKPLTALGEKMYDLRELRIHADTALVSSIAGEYLPLATPLPTPAAIETPWPNDPRGDLSFGSTATYAAHSGYGLSGIFDGYIRVFELEDPLSRYYINRLSYDDCTEALQKNLESSEIVTAYINPFCGLSGRIPLHFIVDVKSIQFEGGKGVRFLIASANYQTVNKMEYIFQGLSNDGRYFIVGHFRPIFHPYIVEFPGEDGVGPFIAWEEGQYEEAAQSYDAFNSRMEKLLNAGVVPLYPALDLLDAMLASIAIK